MVVSFPYCLKHVFKQIEIGVRICDPTNDDLFSSSTQANSEVIASTDNVNLEYQTFLWYHKGKCVLVEQDGIATFYGCSECAPTSKINFSFNVCFKNADAQVLLETIKHTILFELTLVDIDKLNYTYGSVGPYVSKGLKSFLTNYTQGADSRSRWKLSRAR